MLTLIALAAALQASKPDIPPKAGWEFDPKTRISLADGLLGPKSLMLRDTMERMAKPVVSPKHGWEFDYVVGGLSGNEQSHAIRFALYSQESTVGSARPESVVRTLLRLYSYNYKILGLDHRDLDRGPATPPSKLVTAYLCYGGDPGGEQLFDVDPSIGGAPVNTIYFYDLRSFTDPVEETREVAHEYGHATLPPIGGDYTSPEAWANGYLGEKLYLTYLAEARRTGALGPEDTFGATPEALRAWVRKNVDPLVDDALANGPRPALLARKDKTGMDALFALALATARLYGPRLMVRALIVGGNDAKAFPAAAATAAEEPEQTTLQMPAEMMGKKVWVPVGDGDKKKLQGRVGGATVLEVRDGWAYLKPTNPTVKIVVYGVKR